MVLTALIYIAAWAQEFKAPQAKTELVADTTAVMPGKPFRVAVHMTMAPGWHSYFLNPGESGQATSITWHLPAGYKAGPIRWPVPLRKVVAGVAGYVYENEAWLVTEITPANAIPNDVPIKIVADVSWLLCREACVPQKSALSMSLRLGAPTAPTAEFARILGTLPTDQSSLEIKAATSAKTAVLSVTEKAPSTSGVQFFPADATYFGADLPRVRSTASGIDLVIPLSKYAPGPPSRLMGILVVPTGGAKGTHWIDVKVTKR